MEFDAASILASAGERAKSDVANKLVAMALHRISHRVPAPFSVRSPDYQAVVRASFGNHCPFCQRPLDKSNVVLEHLDAMNQFRAGLHVVGNVLPACRRCNLEKRRHDQDEQLPPGVSGWDAFLRHGDGCDSTCKTCAYWARVWPDRYERKVQLQSSLERLMAFRQQHLPEGVAGLEKALAPRLQELYAEAQRYAEEQTTRLLVHI